MESFEQDYREPWERGGDETPVAFAAFVVYRDMLVEFGRRSLRRAAAKYYHDDYEYGVSAAKVRQFEKWSSANDWPIRAEAWDEENDRIKRERHWRAVEDMTERHAKEAMNLQHVAALPARLLTMQFQKNPDEMLMKLNDLTLPDRLRLAFVGARITPRLQAAERLARGEPTEIFEGRTGEGGELTLGADVVERLLQTDEGIAALDAIGRLGLEAPETYDADEGSDEVRHVGGEVAADRP